jgi:hypothetical protein
LVAQKPTSYAARQRDCLGTDLAARPVPDYLDLPSVTLERDGAILLRPDILVR